MANQKISENTDKYHVHLPPGQKAYFASDFHLGAPDRETSLAREQKITRWLESIYEDAGALFLLGDIFDFWFEYKHVIPKGFVRFQGKLAELSDAGIPIYIFTGNHDMWMFDYYPNELNIPVFKKVESFTINNHKFLLGHGDGLGNHERLFKIVRTFFHSSFCQWLFGWIHPNFGVALAHFWSGESRKSHDEEPAFEGADNEWIFQYCKETEAREHHDFYLFGHRHLQMELPINKQAKYINIGEWMEHCTYGVFDGQTFSIEKFNG